MYCPRIRMWSHQREGGGGEDLPSSPPPIKSQKGRKTTYLCLRVLVQRWKEGKKEKDAHSALRTQGTFCILKMAASWTGLGPHIAALMLTSRQNAGSEILGPLHRVLGVLNPNRGNHSNLHMCVSLWSKGFEGFRRFWCNVMCSQKGKLGSTSSLIFMAVSHSKWRRQNLLKDVFCDSE